MENDFEIVNHSVLNDSTEVVTGFTDTSEWESEKLIAAIQAFDSKKSMYSAYTADKESADLSMTLDDLNELANNINSNIDKVVSANAIIRQKIHTNALIGRTYEAIYSNVNSSISLEYPNPEGRNKQKALKQAQECIDEFNRQINIKSFIREGIAGVCREGNRIYNLRIDGGNYVIDSYPLPIGFVTDWEINGYPLLAIDLNKLEERLKKTYQTDKKRKAIWMQDIDDDIKRNYPSAYNDYKNKERYSKLDPKYAKIIRINNLGRKYGVSLFFKALKDDILLEQLANTDLTIAKSKQRKILFQTLRKELLDGGKKKAIAEAVYAHGELMNALNSTSAVYTSSFADDLRYVAPPNDSTNVDKTTSYRVGLMNALGIEYMNTNTGTVSVANISLKQLMRTINSIAEQIENVLDSYYKVVLEENGIDVAYAPHVNIIDSEKLETDVAISLATFLYSTLNSSRRTAYDILGIDYESEMVRREEENRINDTDVFFPRATSYTTSTDDEQPGRPQSDENTDRQLENMAKNAE